MGFDSSFSKLEANAFKKRLDLTKLKDGQFKIKQALQGHRRTAEHIVELSFISQVPVILKCEFLRINNTLPRLIIRPIRYAR